jgi:hypothetical protein
VPPVGAEHHDVMRQVVRDDDPASAVQRGVHHAPERVVLAVQAAQPHDLAKVQHRRRLFRHDDAARWDALSGERHPGATGEQSSEGHANASHHATKKAQGLAQGSRSATILENQGPDAGACFTAASFHSKIYIIGTVL